MPSVGRPVPSAKWGDRGGRGAQVVAVFLDGCFWHGCPEHHTVARTNLGYWSSKVARNRERDAETTQPLIAEGWRVMLVWEHT
jgi:DNA mismatch endonuclease (patch repair protein)